jgi:Transposase
VPLALLLRFRPCLRGAIPQPRKTAMTIVEDTRAITGGVDTHAGLHAAAALDRIGGLLGVREFPATAAGYARLLGWLGGFGDVALAGVEGTGSYGAGLARDLPAAGVRVVEVDRAGRQDRRRQGKPGPLDAISAARAAQSGRASGAPKGRDGAVEAIRALMVAKRSARHERTQAINQARALIVTGPHELRARLFLHRGRRRRSAWPDIPPPVTSPMPRSRSRGIGRTARQAGGCSRGVVAGRRMRGCRHAGRRWPGREGWCRCRE